MLPTAELSDAFAKLKSDLSDSVALKLPNREKPFVLETDGSAVPFTVVLKQIDGDEEVLTLLQPGSQFCAK